jgi:hypothetical protein
MCKPTKNLETMKTNFNSAFTGMTILLIAGCASMTQAPSTPPSATVRIQECSAAYYGSAAAGKGTLYYNGQRHHFTISSLGAGGMGAQKISATGKVCNLNNLSSFFRDLPWHQPRTYPDRRADACQAAERQRRGDVPGRPNRRYRFLNGSTGI